MGILSETYEMSCLHPLNQLALIIKATIDQYGDKEPWSELNGILGTGKWKISSRRLYTPKLYGGVTYLVTYG